VHSLRAALLGICCAALATGASPTQARPACPQNSKVRPALERLAAVMRDGRFVAYQPTSLKVVNGVVSPADPMEIRADLTVLRKKFDALITYDAIHARQIPAIASALGFRALIVGVWNPAAAAEVDAAVGAARQFPQLVIGISLGNETQFFQRIDPQRLSAAIASVHTRAPATALTTTEPFHIFAKPEFAPVLGQLDFLLVNVHPVFQTWFQGAPDATAAQFVVNVVQDLESLGCGPILVKETGEPSAPASQGYSEARQASFYRELRARFAPDATHAFAYFSAFDAPWREADAGAAGKNSGEAHWGLYDADRKAKQAARELPPLGAVH
jgi:exo-beta-1,3-glucanase (GH17 family)